jgi:hypothetical protein
VAASYAVAAEFAGFGNGWTDITTDLTNASVQVTRGFQSDAPDDLVAAPALCQFGLDNSIHNSGGKVGYYSPDSMNCRAGWSLTSRIRIQVTANGHTRTRFIGWVQSITPLAGLYDMQTVAVSAASWLQLAADTLATGVTVQTSKRGDQLVTTLVAIAQFAPPATSYATGIDTYPYALDDLDPRNSYILDGLDSVAKSGLDRIWEKADGTLVYENRNTRQTGATNAATLTDVAPGGTPGLAITDAPLSRARADLYNQFLVTVHPKKIDASAVILYSYQLSASSPTIGPSGASITLDGPYQDPNQLAQHVGGFNMLIDNGSGGSTIGTSGNLPTADWQVTTVAGGGGTDISGSCTVTVVYEATKATFVITNNSGSTGFLAKLQCRGQGIYDYQLVIGRAINTSGVTSLGRRSVTLDCPYQPVPDFAQNAANYLLAVWGQERSRLGAGVPVFAHADDEVSIDTLLALEISDPIGIQETVTGLAGAFWINGVREVYDERCNLTLAFSLAPRWAGQVWKIGTGGSSEIGTTTVLAYV